MSFKFNPLTGQLDYYESGSGGGSASSITNTPAGNIAATDVQAAINELDTEKLPIAGGTITGELTVTNSSANPTLKVTQAGSGYAFVVEDATSDTTPFIINADGTIIIRGTTQTTSAVGTPLLVMHEDTGTRTANFSAQKWRANSAVGGLLEFTKSNSNTQGTNTLVASGDLIGHIDFAGADGTAFIRTASIRAEIDGTPGTNDMPGRLIFLTTADGASAPTEQLRIDSAGLVTLAQNLTVSGTTGITATSGNGSFNGGRFVLGLVGGNAGMSIGLDGSPIQIFRVGVNTLGIKNVSGGVQIQDGSLTVSGDTQTAGIHSTALKPSGNATIPADYGSVVPRKYLVASGKKLTVGLGGRLRIL